MRSLLKVIKQGSAAKSEDVVLIPDGRTPPARLSGADPSAQLSGQDPGASSIYGSLVQQAQQESERLSQRLLHLAHEEREQVLEQARQEGEQLRQQAYAEGYSHGLEDKKAEIDACLKNLNRAIAEVRVQQQQYFEEYAQELQNFAVEIAGSILKRQITLDPLQLRELVLAAVKSVKDAEWITTRLSSQAEPLIRLLREDAALPLQTTARRLEFQETDLAPGGCVIDTSNGTLDASIETQLQNLKEAFSRVDQA